MRRMMWMPALGTLAALARVPAFATDGKAIYESTCKRCHDSGVMGAPKISDKAAWKNRVAQGQASLGEHAIRGFKHMPPRGGNPELSDDDVKAAIKYILQNLE